MRSLRAISGNSRETTMQECVCIQRPSGLMPPGTGPATALEIGFLTASVPILALCPFALPVLVAAIGSPPFLLVAWRWHPLLFYATATPLFAARPRD
eukprot:GDKH01006736.1.p1 GENE.GDKH01006736.1~~GDKH01006736.1.p1  ORF type:complete len:97 (+),score=13.37 GDKH01006736.1:34-324(+)